MFKKTIIFTLLATLICVACTSKKQEFMKMLETDQLIAWCIVPFDAAERSPRERAAMLRELGLTKLAYDYRDKHLASFEEEIEVLKENEITLSAVWLWIQGGEDQLLDPASEFIVSTLEKTGTHTALWVSFPDEYFAGMSDEQKLEKAVNTIGTLNTRLEKAGCSLCLYNHGSWFGEPENQINVIESIGSDNISMVYNFHHAHHQMDRFVEIFTMMEPYLSVVNLNGMTSDGPKIITLGEGEKELEMLRYVMNSGFSGELGILGHTDGEDIKLVLERNLKGLEKMKQQL